MSGVVSRWLGSVQRLPEVAERLLRVQIENRPALDLLDRYDATNTLFYCDPPYVHGSRGDARAYGFEMSDEEHADLAERLSRIEGYAVVSGYRSDLYDHLYAAWRRIDAPPKRCHSVKTPRAEVLWTNR